MQKTLALITLGAALFGCNIRMVAVLETEDAVYGKTKLEKEQSYDPNGRDNLTAVEAIAGAINPEILVRERPTPTPVAIPVSTLPPAATFP